MNKPFSYSRKEPGSSDIFNNSIRAARLSGVMDSIAIVDIRKFYKM